MADRELSSTLRQAAIALEVDEQLHDVDNSRYISGVRQAADLIGVITARMIAEMEACADEADSQELHNYAAALRAFLPESVAGKAKLT